PAVGIRSSGADRMPAPISSDRFSDLHQQPSARQTPIARDSLFHAETAEIAQFHDASFAVVGFPQLIQRVVQRDQAAVVAMSYGSSFAKIDSLQAAAVLGGGPLAGRVDQNAAHDL